MTDSPPWKEDPKNPTRKSSEKRKDKYGNEIKNVAKHLARKAMNSVKEAAVKNAAVAKKAGAKLKMDPDTGTPDHFTAAQRRKKGLPEETEHDNCGTPECCGQCDAEEVEEAAAYQPSAAYQASRNANPYAKQHQDSIDRRNASIKRSRDAVAERQRKKAEELRSGLKTVKEEVEGKVYSVHVKGDSKDHNSPEFKKHLKGWGGELHYASDKGAAYKFKKDYQATGFHHGVKSGFKSLDSEHDGQVKEELGKSNEWGTDALRQKYAAMTPGQEGLAAKKIPTFDPRYDGVPTRYNGGIQKEETLSEISARGAIARQNFRAKIQKVLSDPKAIAKAKKNVAKKKAAEADVPKNLVHQLHKSQSINAKVKFYDGKEHEIAPNHHDKFMNKYHGLKSSIEKESLVKRAHKSHDDFLKAIHEQFADFSQEKPNTDSISPANYPTPPVRDDMMDYNSDDRHDEYDMLAIENDVTAEIENAEWEDLIDYYDYEDLNYEDSDEDIAEGITPQGRLKKRFNMMRTKGRRNLARNMALKRVATPDRIKSRSVRAARNMVYSRVLRGRDRSSLSASEKTRLEGMVKRMAPMVGRLSLRLQQKERMIDRNRINNRNKRKKR